MGEQQLAIGGELLRLVDGGGIGQIEIARRGLRRTRSIFRIVATRLRAAVIDQGSANGGGARQIPQCLDVLRVVDHDAAVGRPRSDARGAGRSQPLHDTTSPGFTCSHTPCSGVMRRALASSTLMRKATFAGTSMRTEPSGSMGA